MNIDKQIEEFRRKYEGANWTTISSKSMDSMVADIKELIEKSKEEERERFIKIIGEDEEGTPQQAPCPDGIVGCAVYHTKVYLTPEAKERNNFREELLTELRKQP